MNDKLHAFLALAYEVRILGRKADVQAAFDEGDPEFIAAVKEECARLTTLSAKCDLSQRDFASYHHLQSMRAALERMKHAG